MRPTLFSAVRTTLLSGLLAMSLPVLANSNELYQISGMQTHQEHFQQALKKAQQRYAAQLPANVADNLMRKSNERFEPQRMHARAAATLQVNLGDDELDNALAFYRRDVGQQVVAAETRATSPAEVSAMQNGLPMMKVSAERKALIDRLAKQLPALDLGEEVSLALAGMATDSANQMLGGLFQIPQELTQQRGALRAQMEPNLPQTLLYVYRDLSDAQLEQYVQWSESDTGRAFFKAANAAAHDALNP
ncbi:MAG: DUF2059 domain-containing protein [Halopseudomonas sp.]|uniref:DUF2059 domain-containing protein n=1 Tax=Halopseudomonas sp. TaxID=2901191 RepID=UPI003001D07A